MSTQIGITPSDPYITPNAGTFTGTPGTGVFEITLTTALATAASPIVSGTTNIQAETYNGAIPGPTFKLTVGDTVIVRLVNNLPYPTGIHWHGIELNNYSDGTEVTQEGALGAPLQTLGNGVPAGGTFLYKFKVTRPGIFWYHPHHHNSTNRVFRGLYGMIVVTDANEDSLVSTALLPLSPNNTLPSVAATKQLVLSDITVCNNPGPNPSYNLALPWVGTTTPGATFGMALPVQPGLSPADLCDLNPLDDDGMLPFTYHAGDVPSLMAMAGQRINEGLTVLTNGVNVGGRAGSPSAPGIVDPSAYKLPVLSGQGLRLQIVNCATTRYFRLRLTDNSGNPVDLVRVGGEGGLLDNAVLEGLTTVPVGTFDPKYESGEILLPPSARADVVVAIPPGLSGTVLTLWTQDFQRLAPGFVNIPTVPVMHLDVTGDVVGTPYGISAGTPLRAKVGFPGPLVDTLGTPLLTDVLLNPTTFGKPGDPTLFLPPALISDIQLTSGTFPSINGIDGSPLHGLTPYTNTPHIRSSRYAAAVVGRILELTVTNATGAHHPFHLHGFSMQPISLTRAANPTFTWLYREFRDSINVPANYTLTFRVRLDDRTLVDGVTLGGWLGRWLFHCHIFFHHHRGMISEFVVTDATGKERPYVNVGGSWAYSPGPTPTRQGTFGSPEGNPVTLAATYGAALALPIGTAAPVVTLAPVGTSPGTWSWTDPGISPPGIYYVYITATDTVTLLQGQAVFRLQIGGADQGGDWGDPHIYTVDGKKYDFQAAGEFVLVRDLEGMEIQTRQTPVVTPPPVKDLYSGLTECVSLNSAAAARVGPHRISYQPWREPGRLQFFLDGKPADLPRAGLDLEGHRVSTFDAGGETGIRIDYAHGPVVKITPNFWTSYGIHYLDVDVSNTHAEGGLIGRIPKGTWLPALPSGATLGPKPASLHDRYVALYQTFADAWRVTDATSMFIYTPGKSTATYSDRDWPFEPAMSNSVGFPQKPPCTTLKPGFPLPVNPIRENIPISRAKKICSGVKLDYLHAACVFDVATTGDESFAKGYLIAQELRLCGSAVQIVGDKPQTRPGETLVVTATVLPQTPGKASPTGSVTFIIDGVPIKPAVKLDKQGRARLKVSKLKTGAHKIRAAYNPGGNNSYHSSSSPNLLHTVAKSRGYTSGGGSDAGYGHTVAKTKKPSRPTARGHKKNVTRAKRGR